MRDIEKYEHDYSELTFEDYQVKYRRKKVIEILTEYKPKRILEIGCGMKPLFPYIDFDYDLYVIVEPSQIFIENAKRIADDNSKVVCYHECFMAKDDCSK